MYKIAIETIRMDRGKHDDNRIESCVEKVVKDDVIVIQPLDKHRKYSPVGCLLGCRVGWTVGTLEG